MTRCTVHTCACWLQDPRLFANVHLVFFWLMMAWPAPAWSIRHSCWCCLPPRSHRFHYNTFWPGCKYWLTVCSDWHESFPKVKLQHLNHPLEPTGGWLRGNKLPSNILLHDEFLKRSCDCRLRTAWDWVEPQNPLGSALMQDCRTYIPSFTAFTVGDVSVY